MILNKGLWLDGSEIDQPEGTWRNLVNGIFDLSTQSITNENGFINFGKNLPDDKNIIGKLEIENNIVLFYEKGSTSFDEIGLLNENGYYNSLIKLDLNFSVNYPIKAKYLQNFKKETIIIWTDNFNDFRFLNLSNIEEVFGTSITSDDLPKFEIFPCDSTININNFVIKNEGGNLLSGKYILFSRFTLKNNLKTEWRIIPNNIIIGDFLNKNENSYNSSKSITFNISITDNINYKSLEIAAINNSDSITTAKLLKTINLVSNSTNVKIDSYEGEDLSLEDILISKAYYNRVKDIEVIEEEIIASNVTSDSEIKYQIYANNIITNFSFREHRDQFSTGIEIPITGFFHDEVYALYICFKLKKGGYSKAFHIPGTNSGNMDLWENQNENYPNIDDFNSISVGGNDLRNSPVRHHIFPSLSSRRVSINSNNFWMDSDFSSPEILTVNFSNIVIPDDIKNKIVSIHFLYAKRTLKDSRIVAQGLLIPQTKKLLTGDKLNSSGFGNFLPNLNNDGSLPLLPTNSKYKFNSFELLDLKPSLNITKVKNELRFRRGLNSITFNERIEYVNNSHIYYHIDNTLHGAISTCNTVTSSDSEINITKLEYIPNNVITENLQNIYGEEHLYLEGDSISIINDSDTDFEELYLSNLFQEITDAYVDFQNITDLIFLDKTIQITNSNNYSINNLGGADCNVSLYNFINTAASENSSDNNINYPVDADGNSNGKGTIISRQIYIESVYRLEKRNINDDHQSKVLVSKNVVASRLDEVISVYKNYDPTKQDIKLYDLSNHFKLISQVIPNNSFLESTNNFPYRIIRSNKTSREEVNVNLTFLANNYFESTKIRGEIIGLNKIDERLIIRHERGLFLTRIKQKFASNDSEVFLGSNDIFDVEPKEIINTDTGFVNSDSVFTPILTEYGLVLIDTIQGKIFLLNRELKQISKFGMNLFIREKFTFLDGEKDNPIIINVDEITNNSLGYKRLKLPKNNNDLILEINKYIWLNDPYFSYAKILNIEEDSSFYYLDTNLQSTLNSLPDNLEYNDISDRTILGGRGAIVGYNRKLETLFITVINEKSPSLYRKQKYIGRFINNDNFKNNLNFGDVVKKRNHNYSNDDGGSSYDVFNEDSPEFNNLITENESYTISYNLKYDFWVSFHNYIPNSYINLSNSLLSIKNNKIYKHDDPLSKSIYYNNVTPNEFIIEIILGNSPTNSSKLSYINWVHKFKELVDVVQNVNIDNKYENLFVNNVTFNKIELNNTYQNVSETILEPYENLQNKGNVRQIKNTWNFNKVRNDSDKKLLTDNFVKVKLIYSNSIINATNIPVSRQYLLYLYSISGIFKPM